MGRRKEIDMRQGGPDPGSFRRITIPAEHGVEPDDATATAGERCHLASEQRRIPRLIAVGHARDPDHSARDAQLRVDGQVRELPDDDGRFTPGGPRGSLQVEEARVGAPQERARPSQADWKKKAAVPALPIAPSGRVARQSQSGAG